MSLREMDFENGSSLKAHAPEGNIGRGDYHCYSAPDPRSRWQKMKHRLFPAKHCFAPEAPSEFKDCIHGHAITKFDFADRIRVLITGVVVTSWRTVTENEVGRTVNAATCHVGTSDDLPK